MKQILTKIKSLADSTQPFRFLCRSARNILFQAKDLTSIQKTIQIEPTSICNAKCVFCNYRLGFRKPASIDPEEFEKICNSAVNSGFKYLDMTSPGGELLVHKNAVELIKTAKKTGFEHIGFYTNAILINKHGAENLLTSGVDALLISFPEFDRIKYKEIYGVDKYELFLESIISLLETHTRINSHVTIIFEPRGDRSSNEIRKSDFYKKYIEPIEGERIALKETIRRFDNWAGSISQGDLFGAMKLEKPIPIKSIYPIKKTIPCTRLFMVGVFANGDVRLCNCRHNSKVEQPGGDGLFIANLRDYPTLNNLLKINQHKIENIRNDFQNGNLPEVCKACGFYSPGKYLGN